MCGISGIVNLDFNEQVEELRLKCMLNILRHRGPDGEGMFLEQNVGLGHRRLSILDLSENGRQPFICDNSRYVVTYNGEVFNYKEIKSELKARGYMFRSETDTEVLVKIFEEKGEAALDQLNGMFAFAIWDRLERELFVVRDRVGIKPIYYSIYNGSFIFASEPKAIFAAGVPSDLNEAAFTELLLYRYVSGEQTVFKHIKRLLPGHSLSLKDGKIRIRRWWNLPEKILANRECLPKDPYKWFEETLSSSVKYRTISDVPVGLMLSGGLDSSSIAIALKENGEHNLAAFNVIFNEQMYNEGPLASQVAERYGLFYHGISLHGDELITRLQEASWLHDEPLVHHNDAQMLALSHYAKNYVTVLLSGEGADELMGGYFRYKALKHPNIISIFKYFSRITNSIHGNDIVNRFDKLNRYLYDTSPESLVLFNVSNIYPHDLSRLGVRVEFEQFEYRVQILKEARSLYPKELARQAMYLDMFTHMSSVLDRNDRMTMGASIECRVPFLDYRFLEMIPALPSDFLLKGKKGKWLLFNSTAKKLPEQIRNFRKLGFSVPWNSYRKENDYIKDFYSNLDKDSIFNLPILNQLNPKVIIGLLDDKVPFVDLLVRHLFMIGLWQKTYLNRVNNLSSGEE